MPKILSPSQRRIQISVPQSILTDMGAAGAESIEQYVAALRAAVVNLQEANKILQAELLEAKK